jgi:hypothetical protein
MPLWHLTRGTEFLDAETRGQNRAERPQSVSRDGKSGTIPTKIPTETAYSEAALGFAVWVGLGGGDSRYRTGCPPPSHRTSLEPESGTGVSNAATERQNRPIWPMFAGRDHASQRLWRACCSQARLGLVRVVVENHSSGYPAVRICRRQCSPSDTSRSLFPQKTVPSRNSSLIVKTPSA